MTLQTITPSPTPASRQTLAPNPGETQDAFFLRGMKALRNAIPSINRRTVEVLCLWCNSPNASDRDLRETAAALFPADKFKHYKPRCIFIEHTVPASEDGSRPEIVYDQAAMQKLVNFANYRIADSGTFSAISNDHTPSQDEKMAGLPMPDVLGYCGPFYLGMLGDKDPKFAIYADEWVHNSDISTFEKLQRRSPEVWTSEPMESRTMDPIAALGASTPRLDSGMNPYCRRSTDDREVMRYSAVAFPGPTNTFVPSAGGKQRPHRYSGDSPMPDALGQDGAQDRSEQIAQALQALLPSIVDAVVEALDGTNADVDSDADLPGAGGGMNDIPGDTGASPTNPTDIQPRGLEQTNSDTQPDEGGVNTATPGGTPAQDDEKKYAAMGGDCYNAFCAGRNHERKVMGGATQYARSGDVDKGLSAVVARQQNQLAEQATKINELTELRARDRRDNMRYSKLNDLARTFQFVPDEEMETCLDMSDDQFDRHCNVTIAKYAKKDDPTQQSDLYMDPSLDRSAPRIKPEDVDKYSKEAATRASQKNFAAKKNVTTFQAEFDAILKEHGIAV